MLEDLTIGVILTIKHGYKGEQYKDALKKFLADWTLIPIEFFLEDDIKRILVICFEDYIGNHKSARWVITEFFMNKNGIHNMNDMDSIITCFNGAQIRDRIDEATDTLRYVNGFHDFEFNELKLKEDNK